jgi:hypothetical protein
MASDPGQQFRDTVCSFKIVFYHLLAFEVALFVLHLFSLFTIQTRGRAYALLEVNLAVLSVATVATVAALVYCTRKNY